MLRGGNRLISQRNNRSLRETNETCKGRWVPSTALIFQVYKDQWVNCCANLAGLRRSLGVRASDDEGAVEVDRTKDAILLDPEIVGLGEAIEAEVVCLQIDLGK